MYQLQSSHKANPFSQFAMTDFHGAPTRDQARLMQHVFEALQKGIFYTSDMSAYIIGEMKDVLPKDNFITPEYLKKGMTSEGGPFGMDIYRCRNAVETILEYSVNRQSLKALMRDNKIAIGKKIKGKIRIGDKNFTTLTPVEINEGTGEIRMMCSGRGFRAHYTATLGANETRLLQMLTTEVKDKTISSESAEGFTTVTIDPMDNRHQEMSAQYA